MEAAPGCITAERARCLASRRHQSCEPGRSIVRAARTGANRPQAHSRDSRARSWRAARGGSRQYQYRSHRRSAWPDSRVVAESLAWIEKLCDLRTSRSTCLKLTKTAVWAARYCSTVNATALPTSRRRIDCRALRNCRRIPCSASGIHRYEISNFARPGFESLHNLKYWRLEPYLGFGADAHSFDGVVRCQNIESAGDYVDRMRERANRRDRRYAGQSR